MNTKEFYEKKLEAIKHKVEMTDTHSLIWNEIFDAYEQLLDHLMYFNYCIEDVDYAIKKAPNKEELYKWMLDSTRKRMENELNFKIPDEVHEQWCDDIKEDFKDE